MDKDVVKSNENEGSLHDFIDFSFAKEVVKDHPRIIEVYTKLLPVLYKFAAYQGVWPVIQMVEDSKLLLELQYTYYKKIHDKKGRI